VVTQAALLAGLALWIPWWSGQPWRETLGFTKPRNQTLYLAILVGITSPAITLLFHSTPDGFALSLGGLALNEWAALTPPAALFVVAIVTGLCEEWMFRGALLGLLRNQRVAEIPAVVASAVAFGVFHIDPTQILPSATLGLCLGVLAFRSKCVWPAVLAHSLHNVMIVLGGGAWLLQTQLAGPIACLALTLPWLTRRET